jgi:hypothetical protein
MVKVKISRAPPSMILILLSSAIIFHHPVDRDDDPNNLTHRRYCSIIIIIYCHCRLPLLPPVVVKELSPIKCRHVCKKINSNVSADDGGVAHSVETSMKK